MTVLTIIYFVIGAIVALVSWKLCANNPKYEMSDYTLRGKLIVTIHIFLFWPVTLIVTICDHYMYRKGR